MRSPRRTSGRPSAAVSSSPPIHIPESDWDDEEEHRHDSMAEYREHLFWLRMANAGRTTYPAPEEAFLQHHFRHL